MRTPYLFPIFLVCFFSLNLYSQVVINEVSNANGSVLYAEDDEAYDWIELYNSSSSSINLSNFSLTDEAANPTKWILPNISIASFSFIVILASGRDTLVGNYIHANFKIAAEGESLTLSDASGNIIDSYQVADLQNNHSVGRKPDGSPNWCLFNSPSPDATNNNATCYEGYEAEPIFSLNAGFYPVAQIVELYTPSPTGTVRFTLDGDFPSMSDNIYSQPFPVNTTKVISARSFSNSNRLPSKTVKRTYFINEGDLDLPVFSITLNPDDLWDYNTGMYVMGPDASSSSPYYGANFWKDWEKLCHVEYFDKNKVKQFELDAGLAIHGGYSRAKPQRSFRIYARDEYGTSSVDFPLIPEKSNIKSYKRFNLRNGGSDYGHVRFRDAFMQRVLKDSYVDRMGYEPALVFLNGEYWGHYGIREKQDARYIESNHGIPKEKVDILYQRGSSVRAQSGSVDGFNTMHGYITSANQQSPGFYNEAAQMLDIYNFADYFIGETYYSNSDWIDETTPANNIKLWRSQLPGGRWRYIFWDLDQASGIYGKSPTINILPIVINPAGPNMHSDILRSLLKNTQFKYYFINRYADLMNTAFQAVNIEKVAFSMRDSIKSSMPRHTEKWGSTYSTWYTYVDKMVEWHFQRLSLQRGFIQNQFSLTKQVNVTLATSPPEAGRIKISTIIPDSLPWTGVYYDGVPVTITAIANPGFTFDHWGVNGNISNPETSESITLNITSDDIFTAFFNGSAVEPKLTFSEINYHSAPFNEAGDWVEVHNFDNISVNLTGWYIKDGNDANIFQIPFGTIVPPNGYVVFSCDTMKFKSQHPGVVNFKGQLPFSFKNSGDNIRLFKYDNSLFLSAIYSDSPPWPKEPDGQGETLELKDPFVSLSSGSNWFAGCPGGSPGKVYDPKCITEIPEVPESDAFQLLVWPNPSSDFININVISANEDITDMSLSIYDFLGNEVKSIVSLKDREIIVNRAEFATGIYIIKVGNEKSFLTRKIIFQ